MEYKSINKGYTPVNFNSGGIIYNLGIDSSTARYVINSIEYKTNVLYK